MSRSTFSGPILSGTVRYGQYKAVGNSSQAQSVTLTQNGTNVVNGTMYIPALSQITSFTVDTTVSWNSATSATLTIGTASGGTQYVTSVDVKASTGRSTLTFTQAQLIAMLSAAQDNTVSTAAGAPLSTIVVTVTPVGATTAGTTVVTMHYLQYDDRQGTYNA